MHMIIYYIFFSLYYILYIIYIYLYIIFLFFYYIVYLYLFFIILYYILCIFLIILYILYYIILNIYIYTQFYKRNYWYLHMCFGQNNIYSSSKFQTCAAQWWDDMTPCVHHGTNEHIWMVNGAQWLMVNGFTQVTTNWNS